MKVLSLCLTDFRSHASTPFEPSPEVTILHGPNGAGKTNLLEAIYFLSTTKGFRTGRDGELIAWGSESCEIMGQISTNHREVEVMLRFSAGSRKQGTVDGASAKPAEIIGLLHAIDFSSRDLSLIRGEPSRRREFLDIELAQESGAYAVHLARYKRALTQRNQLLSHLATGAVRQHDLDVWDHQLIEHGEPLTSARMEIVEALSPIASEMHQALAGGDEKLVMQYVPDAEPGALTEALGGARRDDIRRGTTGRGPHRDDISLTVQGQSARQYASQGQQRTAVLALKLSQARLAERRRGEPPVVLLDDVLSDLDEGRRARLLELFSGDAQMIMTCTEPSQLPESVLASAKLMRVENSVVSETCAG